MQKKISGQKMKKWHCIHPFLAFLWRFLSFEHKKSKLLHNIISYIKTELLQKIGKNARIFLRILYIYIYLQRGFPHENDIFCVFVKYRSIEYRTPEFWKVSEYRYQILALKYRKLEYRIQNKVSGAQLWWFHNLHLSISRPTVDVRVVCTFQCCPV
jgi:hypothetical protein